MPVLLFDELNLQFPFPLMMTHTFTYLIYKCIWLRHTGGIFWGHGKNVDRQSDIRDLTGALAMRRSLLLEMKNLREGSCATSPLPMGCHTPI